MFTYEKARKFAKKLSSVYSVMGDNLTVANQYAIAISPGYTGCDKVTLDADNLFKSLSAFQKDDVIELSVVGNKSPVVLSCEQKLALIMPVC